MRELELTWSQAARIWWAAFWRWLVLANLSVGFLLGVVGLGLWALGIKQIPWAPWMDPGLFLLTVPAAVMAMRLAVKARYTRFRIAIVARPE